MTSYSNRERGRTPAQLEAVESTNDKILVLAGPGSGKTATLVGRINRLVDSGVEPRKITVLTFTNAAARELERRLFAPACPGVIIDTRGGIDDGKVFSTRLGYCGTLHGFALRCLQKHGGAFGYGERMAVINPEGAEALLGSANRRVGNGNIPMKVLLAQKALGRQPRPTLVADLVVASYFAEIREAGIVDFDVLLTEFARCLEDETLGFRDAVAVEFEHLFVDEVQDSAAIDWRIFRSLPIANKFLVGDPDQSIYSFRGAALEETIACAADPAWQVLKLEENFRSLSRITDAAQRLIERNAGRVAKRTIGAVGVGGLVWAREAANPGAEAAEIAVQIKMELAAGHAPEVIGVLARTNAVAAELAKLLAADGIPVAGKVETKLPPDLRLLRSLVSYLCNPDNDTLGFLYTVERLLAQNPANVRAANERAHEIRNVAALGAKTINETRHGFPRRLFADAVPQFLDRANVSAESKMFVAEKLRELPDGAPMIELAHALGANFETAEARATAEAGVKVLTIHGAKGREFDVVFLAGFEDEAIPGRRKDVDVEEERRLAYVGITRARRVVHFTWARTRESKWKGVEPRTPSRFVEEAKDK